MQSKGWFYIVAPSQHGHVLTLSNMSYESGIRVELRPNNQGSHQLWYLDEYGYIINKHSGCVLAVKNITKKKSVEGQNIIQTSRKNEPAAKEQQWEFVSTDKENTFRLKLKAIKDYYLIDKQVPSFQLDDSVEWSILYK
ncbi:hypothetical protein BJ944DRAFT_238170 [Cunninghamella echinulata]|nr:hypothetical protein BJ944DRAFT_238170 [Cunninghamella echinulata]